MILYMYSTVAGKYNKYKPDDGHLRFPIEHDHLNKLSITFQQKDQCEIWWKMAKWFLKNHDFIHVNSTVAGKYNKYKPDDGHLRFPIRTILTTVDLQVISILSI